MNHAKPAAHLYMLTGNYKNPGTQLILDPDASEHAVGVVLSQVIDGVEQPIQFWSQVLKKY